MLGRRTIQNAIKDEAAKYGAKVEFDVGKHPVFYLIFPNGSRIKDTYSSSPANIDDEAQFNRQRVRRAATRAGCKLLTTDK